MKKLTKKELEIVDLVSEGLADKQICSILRISYGTLRQHLDRIFLKTRSDSRITMLKNLQYIKKPDNLSEIVTTLWSEIYD